jgi:hypothetical protein
MVAAFSFAAMLGSVVGYTITDVLRRSASDKVKRRLLMHYWLIGQSAFSLIILILCAVFIKRDKHRFNESSIRPSRSSFKFNDDSMTSTVTGASISDSKRSDSQAFVTLYQAQQ